MKRHIAAGFTCLALSFAVLDAHVIVTPRESAAGAEEVYTVRVPNERTVVFDVARARDSRGHARGTGAHRARVSRST